MPLQKLSCWVFVCYHNMVHYEGFAPASQIITGESTFFSIKVSPYVSFIKVFPRVLLGKKQTGRKQSSDRSLPFFETTNSSPLAHTGSGRFFSLCRRSDQEQVAGQFFRHLGYRVSHDLKAAGKRAGHNQQIIAFARFLTDFFNDVTGHGQ